MEGERQQQQAHPFSALSHGCKRWSVSRSHASHGQGSSWAKMNSARTARLGCKRLRGYCCGLRCAGCTGENRRNEQTEKTVPCEIHIMLTLCCVAAAREGWRARCSATNKFQSHETAARHHYLLHEATTSLCDACSTRATAGGLAVHKQAQ